MSGPKGFDEFDLIGRLFRPLAKDSPEALGLMDDAAILPGRPGFDLIVTKDAIVEGVHFLSTDPLDLVARKALRVNLSDLAAKGAEPYGYLLAVAWPPHITDHESFARGLQEDQDHFGLKLFGGDTVSTPGPMTVSITMLGWVPEGGTVKRSGAQVGDDLVVSGAIGDGYLGLHACQGKLSHLDPVHIEHLQERYRLPRPRLDLRLVWSSLKAGADISDGVIADAGRIAEASGLGVQIDLEDLPLSLAAEAWVMRASNECEALVALATGGDDYELVGATRPGTPGPWTRIGRFTPGGGVYVTYAGEEVMLARTGFRHGKDR